jgi:hypothetical protein
MIVKLKPSNRLFYRQPSLIFMTMVLKQIKFFSFDSGFCSALLTAEFLMRNCPYGREIP